VTSVSGIQPTLRDIEANPLLGFDGEDDDEGDFDVLGDEEDDEDAE
jgi:hypothetical protein